MGVTSPSRTPKQPDDLSWTKGEKRFFVGMAVIALLAVALWTMGSTTVQRSEWCRTCLSFRTTRQWGLGLQDGSAFIAAGTDVEVRESDLARLLQGHHIHEWHLESTSTTVLGSNRGIACNMRHSNPVAARFDERYPFRDYIATGLREGSITTVELGAMVSLPGSPAADVLGDPRQRALLETAQVLLAADRGGRDPTWDAALSRQANHGGGK